MRRYAKLADGIVIILRPIKVRFIDAVPFNSEWMEPGVFWRGRSMVAVRLKQIGDKRRHRMRVALPPSGRLIRASHPLRKEPRK